MWTLQTKLLQITAFSLGITKLNQRIILKDDIEFVTEFPCLLGHPVDLTMYTIHLRSWTLIGNFRVNIIFSVV